MNAKYGEKGLGNTLPSLGLNALFLLQLIAERGRPFLARRPDCIEDCIE
jgi:hypothetical protein